MYSSTISDLYRFKAIYFFVTLSNVGIGEATI
jgi:hypothetical protein